MNLSVRNIGVASLPFAKTLDEAAVNLLDHGFTRLYSGLPQRFNKVVAPFAALTEDSAADLLKIEADREKHADGTSDLGLRVVRKGDKKYNPRADEIAENRLTYDETKFIYHGNDRAIGYIAQHPELLEKYSEFFFQSMTLHSETVVLGLELADRLDALLPGYQFAKRLLAAQGMARLRLLRYLCDGDLPSIAQRHRDQDFWSFHIRSDRRGLWLADRYNKAIIADAQEMREDSILIFFGRKAWEITHGKLQGIVHGVGDPLFGSTERTPRHTAVDFQHVEVPEAALQWAAENMDQLKIPEPVSTFQLPYAA